VKQKRNKVSVEAGAWSVILQARSVPGTGISVLPHDMVDTDRSVLIDIDRLAWIVASVGCCKRGSATEFYIYDTGMSYEADREQRQQIIATATSTSTSTPWKDKMTEKASLDHTR
jgi:hypothetical protein